MTAKSAGLDFDYDQHEWLGDGVLKLLQSDALLSSPELRVWVNYLHEGDLTTSPIFHGLQHVFGRGLPA
jgi:hypothetical protein